MEKKGGIRRERKYISVHELQLCRVSHKLTSQNYQSSAGNTASEFKNENKAKRNDSACLLDRIVIGKMWHQERNVRVGLRWEETFLVTEWQ